MPQAPLNQYVMTGGGGIFTIPCSVGYDGSDAAFYYQLVYGLDWTIQQEPSAMLPRVPNGSSTVGGSTEIFPQHTPPVTPPSTVPGLAFENVLPAGNNFFGRNSVTHNFQGAPLDVSDIEVFYQAGAITHANGLGSGGVGVMQDPNDPNEVTADHSFSVYK